MSSDNTSPKTKKNKKKTMKDNVSNDQEDNYSIAKLLERKDNSKNSKDEAIDQNHTNGNDTDEINALIEQTELIRQSTMATVMEYQELQNSPIRNPLKLHSLEDLDTNNETETETVKNMMMLSKKERKQKKQKKAAEQESLSSLVMPTKVEPSKIQPTTTTPHDNEPYTDDVEDFHRVISESTTEMGGETQLHKKKKKKTKSKMSSGITGSIAGRSPVIKSVSATTTVVPTATSSSTTIDHDIAVEDEQNNESKDVPTVKIDNYDTAAQQKTTKMKKKAKKDKQINSITLDIATETSSSNEEKEKDAIIGVTDDRINSNDNNIHSENVQDDVQDDEDNDIIVGKSDRHKIYDNHDKSYNDDDDNIGETLVPPNNNDNIGEGDPEPQQTDAANENIILDKANDNDFNTNDSEILRNGKKKRQQPRWTGGLTNIWSKMKQSVATSPTKRSEKMNNNNNKHPHQSLLSSGNSIPYNNTDISNDNVDENSLSNFDSSDMSQQTESYQDNKNHNDEYNKIDNDVMVHPITTAVNSAPTILHPRTSNIDTFHDDDSDHFDEKEDENKTTSSNSVYEQNTYDNNRFQENNVSPDSINNSTTDVENDYTYNSYKNPDNSLVQEGNMDTINDDTAELSPYYDEDDTIYDDDDDYRNYNYNTNNYFHDPHNCRTIQSPNHQSLSPPEWILDGNTGEYYYIDEYGQYQYYNEDDYDDDGNYLYHNNVNNDRECYNENNYDIPDDEELTNHDPVYGQNYHHDSLKNRGSNNMSTRMQKSLQEHRKRKKMRRQRYIYLLMGLMGCCIIVGSIVLLVLLLLPSHNDHDNTTNNLEDLHALCVPYIDDAAMVTVCTNYTNAILPVHPTSTVDKLYDDSSSSCQYQSFDWLIRKTDSNSKTIYNTQQMIQRYAMTVFHCELYASKWLQLDLHLSGINHACTWSKSDMKDPITGASTANCNSNNEITIIRIIGNNDNDEGSTENKEKHDLPFTGTLPPEVSMITTLQELTLKDHYGNLYGTIPIEYTSNNLIFLNKIDLSSNALNGTIPAENDFIFRISHVDLSNNSLSGAIPKRQNDAAIVKSSSSASFLSTSQLRTTSSQNKTIHSSAVDTKSNFYYYDHSSTRQRTLQQNEKANSTMKQAPISLLLHENHLSGIVSLPDILHPFMEELTLHNNNFVGRLITPSSPDQATKLELFTLYNNNVTGNFNSVCLLSGTADNKDKKKFVVDTDKIVCSCCTNSSDINGNIGGGTSPTIVVPKIAPPSKAPTRVPTTTAIPISTNMPTLIPIIQPNNVTLTGAPSSTPTKINVTASPTNGTSPITISPTTMPTLSSVNILAPTSTISNNTTLHAPVSNNNNNETDDGYNFTAYKPFINTSTTRMGAYVAGKCSATSEVQPHILYQCDCYSTVQVLSNDIATLYSQVRDKINTEIYAGTFSDSISSCTVQNQALIWLSSGIVRDGGDLYQRYILAVIYIQMKGGLWYNRTNWLTYFSECDWYGVECNINTKQIKSITLDNNNLENTIPTEIKYLSGLQTLSLSSNQINGPIPSSILSILRLEQLSLLNNSITGTIPSSPTTSHTFRILQFDTNLITGTIPSWISNATTLSTISMHSNKITGTIPSSIGTNLKGLQFLILHNNRLAGTIPTHLGLLSKLEVFTIDQNNITGTIPSEICQLRKSNSTFTTLIADVCPTSSTSSATTTSVSHCPAAVSIVAAPCCSSCRNV